VATCTNYLDDNFAQTNCRSGRTFRRNIPGGGKATFEKKIEKARLQTDDITLEDHLDVSIFSKGDRAPADKELAEMAETIPEYVVIAAYADIENILLELAKALDQPAIKRRMGPGFFGYLEGTKLITPEVTEALMDLYEARSIATHAKGENRITPGQAIEFLRQARILEDALKKALARLETPKE
jgi:hypothetical protein